MIQLGTIGFGLVIGWSSGFVTWSRRGFVWRAAVALTAALVLVLADTPSVISGILGIVLGMSVHEVLLGFIGRRAR